MHIHIDTMDEYHLIIVINQTSIRIVHINIQSMKRMWEIKMRKESPLG